GPYVNSRQKAAGVKAEVVDYARQKWPMFFSRFFEASKFSGITFLDEKERRLLQLSYPEVTGVNTMRDGQGVWPFCVSPHSEGRLLSECSDGWEHSRAGASVPGRTEGTLPVRCRACRRSTKVDDPTFLSFKKGELIVLIKDDELTVGRGWIKGKNERTSMTGAVPTDAILVLPTLTKPTNEVMSLLNLSPDQRKSIMAANHKETGTVERVAPVSLKEFSYEYFRQPIKDVNRQVISKNVVPECLWANSREPIRQPLLKRLYMGDYPTKQIQSPVELTDQIFGPATKDEALRDEIYCQIMKQMTSNNNRAGSYCSCAVVSDDDDDDDGDGEDDDDDDDDCCCNRFSLEQGWQLLWLCCDAIQQNSTQIFHKVHFPNNMEEVFEVNTSTRIRDLCQTISAKLQLVSSDGFSIFVKTPDKVLSLNDSDYFFDSLRQITDWSKKAKSVKEGGGPMNMTYLVFFMRKLWFNELPKYLRGYHRCTKEDMVNVGALLFRVKSNNDKSQFVMIPKMLKDLVPGDMLKAMSATEWQKNIVAAYNKQAGMTAEEAMLAFLKVVCRWPTFGCAFFEVKDVLATHPFNRIANWCSGSTYFHITVGNLVKGNKILCETSL
ncbi:unnamed protein product, partial [Coregonus sp. 'balchen']